MARRAWPRSGVRTRLPVAVRRAAQGFDPKSISGLALWLDAASAGSLFQNSNGTTAATQANDPVGYWRDLSGNGRHATQSTLGSRPALSSTLFQGVRPVTWDGGSDFSLFTDASVGSVFIVLVCQQLLSANPAESLYSIIGYRNPLNAQDGIANIGVRRDNNVSPADRYLHPGNAGDFTNPSGSQMRINRVATNLAGEGVWHLLTALRGGSALTINNLGAHFANRDFSGQMAEVICYDSKISDLDRDKVETYLMSRWSLA